MKKLLALVAVMCFAGSLFAGDWTIVPKLGIDNGATMKSDISGFPGMTSMDSEVDMSYSISVDVLKKVNKNVKAGLGIEYQMAKNLSKINKETPKPAAEAYFMPIYLTGQYYVAKKSKMAPYVKLNLGYSMYDGNSAFKQGGGTDAATMGMGLYYALGIGAKLHDKIIGEILYSSYSGTREWTGGTKTTETVNLIGLRLGYKFALS